MGVFVPHIEVNENNSCHIQGTLKDENKIVVPVAQITTATMAIVCLDSSLTSIRAASDISADINSSGYLDTLISGAENAMIDETAKYEYHLATISIDATSGDGRVVNFVIEVGIKICNLRTV